MKRITSIGAFVVILLLLQSVTAYAGPQRENFNPIPASGSFSALGKSAVIIQSTENDTLINESFEEGTTGWMVSDNDGDGYTWTRYTETEPYDTVAHSGAYGLGVLYNSSGNDDWLVAPQVTLPTGVTSISFSFWAHSISSSYPEDFNVKLSTGSTDLADFTVTLGSVTDVPQAWTQYTYDLTDYAGETVYLAVQCVSVDDWFLFADDFLLVAEGGGTDVVADFTADITSGTAPLTVNFTDQSTGATTWEWDFDNDGTLDATAVQNPSFTYDNAGTYTVSLTVTDGAGTIDTETKTDYITVSTAGGAITSTTTGGNWSEAGTWVGGVVPTASDNVIIDGDVVVDQTSECADLTVNTGNILRSGTGFYQNLTVNGVLSNAGTIQDNGDTELNLILKGNLNNSGLIENDDIMFEGAADQYISMSSGAVFQNVHFGAKDSTTSVILTSDLELTDCEIDFDWSDETTSLIIPEGSGFRLELLGTNCFATDIIIDGNGNELYMSQGAYLYQDAVLSNTRLTGTVRAGSQSVTFTGDSVVVVDTLQSNTGFYNTLYANSTLINRGIIQDVGDTEFKQIAHCRPGVPEIPRQTAYKEPTETALGQHFGPDRRFGSPARRQATVGHGHPRIAEAADQPCRGQVDLERHLSVGDARIGMLDNIVHGLGQNQFDRSAFFRRKGKRCEGIDKFGKGIPDGIRRGPKPPAEDCCVRMHLRRPFRETRRPCPERCQRPNPSVSDGTPFPLRAWATEDRDGDRDQAPSSRPPERRGRCCRGTIPATGQAPPDPDRRASPVAARP